MATIQRPTKEGSVRTYQEKVGLGFVDILASEMDADLDTIYAAWNGGVDNVTLKDGAVSDAKISDVAWTKLTGTRAAGGDLGSTYPNPTVVKSAGDFSVGGACNIAGLFNASGDGTFAGRLRTKFHQGGVTGAGQVVAQGVTAELSLPSLNYDTGGMTSNSRVWSPAFPSVIAINIFVSVNVVNGLGYALKIEQWTGSAFFPIAQASTTTQTSMGASVIWPSAAGMQYRATITNATTGSITVTQAFLFSGSCAGY